MSGIYLFLDISACLIISTLVILLFSIIFVNLILDDTGEKYNVLYLIHETDYSAREFLSNCDYVINTFDDYDATHDYFVKLKFAVDKSEGCQFLPNILPFP